jgi:TraB/PrgY/gumN family
MPLCCSDGYIVAIVPASCSTQYSHMFICIDVTHSSDGYTEPQEVYLLGTSHVSEQSAADVRRVVAAVKPESIVVELCRGRLGMMLELAPGAAEEDAPPNPLGISGGSLSEAIQRSVQTGGQGMVSYQILHRTIPVAIAQLLNVFHSLYP